MTTALSWTQERIDPPRDNRIAAVLRCPKQGCTSVQKIPIGALGSSPEWIKKLFERKGWEVDQHNIARCLCPNCKKTRKVIAAPLAPPEPARRQINDAPPRRLVDAVRLAREDARTTKENTVAAPIAPPQKVDLASIPAPQKLRIRQKLDAYFDDAQGAYMGGHTDQSLAKDLNLPVSMVYSLREAAYGPLKRDPEVDDLLRELEAVRKKLADAQSDMAKVDAKAQIILKRLGL
jgi:hypothetical protein